jgi:hypothetical protein
MQAAPAKSVTSTAPMELFQTDMFLIAILLIVDLLDPWPLLCHAHPTAPATGAWN